MRLLTGNHLIDHSTRTHQIIEKIQIIHVCTCVYDGSMSPLITSRRRVVGCTIAHIDRSDTTAIDPSHIKWHKVRDAVVLQHTCVRHHSDDHSSLQTTESVQTHQVTNAKSSCVPRQRDTAAPCNGTAECGHTADHWRHTTPIQHGQWVRDPYDAGREDQRLGPTA